MKYVLNMLYKFAVCLHHGAINDNKSNVPDTQQQLSQPSDLLQGVNVL